MHVSCRSVYKLLRKMAKSLEDPSSPSYLLSPLSMHSTLNNTGPPEGHSGKYFKVQGGADSGWEVKMMGWVTLSLFSSPDVRTRTGWPTESENKELCAHQDFSLSIWDKLQVFMTLIPSLINSHVPCLPCKAGDNIYHIQH